MKRIKTIKWPPKIEGAMENLLKPAEVPLLVQTFPCRPKNAPQKSGATVPLTLREGPLNYKSKISQQSVDVSIYFTFLAQLYINYLLTRMQQYYIIRI